MLTSGSLLATTKPLCSYTSNTALKKKNGAKGKTTETKDCQIRSPMSYVLGDKVRSRGRMLRLTETRFCIPWWLDKWLSYDISQK
jgi:hypothetical protein